MNIALWMLQVLLGVMYGFAGQLKALQYDKALAMLAWVKDVPHPLVTFIGICEMLGAVGLILPWLTGIKRWLTPLAALGLATIMTLTLPFHFMRGEWKAIPFNLVLLGLNAFVAWGRLKSLRQPPR